MTPIIPGYQMTLSAHPLEDASTGERVKRTPFAVYLRKTLTRVPPAQLTNQDLSTSANQTVALARMIGAQTSLVQDTTGLVAEELDAFYDLIGDVADKAHGAEEGAKAALDGVADNSARITHESGRVTALEQKLKELQQIHKNARGGGMSTARNDPGRAGSSIAGSPNNDEHGNDVANTTHSDDHGAKSDRWALRPASAGEVASLRKATRDHDSDHSNDGDFAHPTNQNNHAKGGKKKTASKGIIKFKLANNKTQHIRPCREQDVPWKKFQKLVFVDDKFTNPELDVIRPRDKKQRGVLIVRNRRAGKRRYVVCSYCMMRGITTKWAACGSLNKKTGLLDFKRAKAHISQCHGASRLREDAIAEGYEPPLAQAKTSGWWTALEADFDVWGNTDAKGKINSSTGPDHEHPTTDD